MAVFDENWFIGPRKMFGWLQENRSDLDANEVAEVQEAIELDCEIIHEDKFEEFVEGEIEDLFDIELSQWPFTHIKMGDAIDEYRQAWEEIEIHGQTYLYDQNR